MTRILIVEDEAVIARDLHCQLRDLGYEPLEIAVDGNEAVDFARRDRPHLVLMDIHLAGSMDGITAATIIRKELGTPCVFLTAYANTEVVERAKQADPSGYIIKPFDAQVLRTTIEIALNKDRLDRELRRSEARYRAVVMSASDAVVTANAAGLIVDWSPSAARLFGYEEDEVIGLPVTTLMDSGYWRQHEEFDGAVAPSHAPLSVRPQTDPHALTKDRRSVPVEISLARWADGEQQYVTAFIRDITERRSGEEALIRSRARLAEAQRIARIGSWEVDLVTGRALWSDETYAIVDTVPRDAEPTFERFLGAIDPADQPHVAEHFRHCVETGEIGEVLFRITARDGSTKFVRGRCMTYHDEKGVALRASGTLQDVTDHKRLEQQLIQAQKMEVIGRLAGGVAHDFNNLLTIINGTCELALADLPGGHPLRADFEEIQGAGERASRLTRQLLAFSRRQMLTPEVIDVAAQALQSGKMLRRLIGEDITLSINASADGPQTVYMDASQLEQVLLNLAVNARDAMPNGGTLSIETAIVQLDERAAASINELKPGAYVMLAVRDTGAGMTPDVLERVFDPFFTTKGSGKGTGLGLATVYGVVHQSGGTIDVISEPGRGSCFRIYMPQVFADAPARVEAATPQRASGTETVLLVEDESALRDMTARILQTSGYRVVTAQSAEDALNVIADLHDVALVITDVVMPGMSGADLALRLDRSHPGLQVLFISGYTDDKLAHVKSMTRAHFLPKPFTGTLLTRKVRQILDGSSAEVL